MGVIIVMRKFIIFTVLSAIVISMGWWLMFRYFPNQDTAKLTEIQLKSNITSIARKNTKDIFSLCKILTNQQKLKVAKSNYEFFKNMKNTERIIYLRGGDGAFTKNHQPIQIYGIFESWLFIQNKKLPYDVIAISWVYTSGGIDNNNGQITTITKPEFDELYNSNDTNGLTNEQGARILAQKWIEKTGYIKQ